jgi:hypothetical protein
MMYQGALPMLSGPPSIAPALDRVAVAAARVKIKLGSKTWG